MRIKFLKMATMTQLVILPVVTMVACSSNNNGKDISMEELNSLVTEIKPYGTQGGSRLIQQYEELEKTGIITLDSMIMLGISFTIPETDEGVALWYELSRVFFQEGERAIYNVEIRAKHKERTSQAKLDIEVETWNTLGPREVVNYVGLKLPSIMQDQNNVKTSAELDYLSRSTKWYSSGKTQADAELFLSFEHEVDAVTEKVTWDQSKPLLIQDYINELGIEDFEFPEMKANIEYRFSLIKNPTVIGEKHSYELTIVPHYPDAVTDTGAKWHVYARDTYRRKVTLYSSDICTDAQAVDNVKTLTTQLKTILTKNDPNYAIQVDGSILNLDNLRESNFIINNSPLSKDLWSSPEIRMDAFGGVNATLITDLQSINYKGVSVVYEPIEWDENNDIQSNINLNDINSIIDKSSMRLAKHKWQATLNVFDAEGNSFVSEDNTFEFVIESKTQSTVEYWTQYEISKLLAWNTQTSTKTAEELIATLAKTQLASNKILSPHNPFVNVNGEMVRANNQFENTFNSLGFNEELRNKFTSSVWEWDRTSSTVSDVGKNTNWRYGYSSVDTETTYDLGVTGAIFHLWANVYNGSSGNTSGNSSVAFKLKSSDYIPHPTSNSSKKGENYENEVY